MKIENVKQAIHKLEAIDPSKEYAYEKALLAYLKIKQLPILYYDVPPGTCLFRTRTHQTDNLYKKISNISIAPNSCVKNFARCNRPYQSKFYCSENRPTSYMELVEYWVDNKEVGDKIYVTIGKWQLKKALRSILITTPDISKRISDFDIHHGKALDRYLKGSETAIREATVLFYRYLFDKFSKSANKDLKTYIITSSYCNLALSYSEGEADGFYYPSVPFSGQGVNYAINAEFVDDRNMEPKDVLRNEMYISERKNGKRSFSESNRIVATSVNVSKNLINW